MKRCTTTIAVTVVALLVTSAYAATIDTPGPISFTPNGDSHWKSDGGGLNQYVNTDNFVIEGSVDSAGESFFSSFDVGFIPVEDANGYKTQIQLLDDATGTYCPNSGAATITMTARIKITKVAGTSIATTPCYLSINGGSAFTLTTGTSGSYTGVPMTQSNPKFVAAVTFGMATGSCSMQSTINQYFGVTSGSSGYIQLFDADIGQSFTGDGC